MSEAHIRALIAWGGVEKRRKENSLAAKSLCDIDIGIGIGIDRQGVRVCVDVCVCGWVRGQE